MRDVESLGRTSDRIAYGGGGKKGKSIRAVQGSVLCSFEGCSKRTCDRKPYCHDHTEHNPHAARVLAELERKEQERAKVVPVWLDHGHCYVPKEAVETYGRDFIRKLNSGVVDPSTLLRLAKGKR